jgi:hypothetical protein
MSWVDGNFACDNCELTYHYSKLYYNVLKRYFTIKCKVGELNLNALLSEHLAADANWVQNGLSKVLVQPMRRSDSPT